MQRRGRITNLLLGCALAWLPASAQAATDWNAEALQLFKTAVETPTVAGRGQVPVLLQYFADRFAKAGFAAADVHLLPYVSPLDNHTAALIVTLRAKKATKKPILLISHVDVVEAKASDWARDPFRLIEEGGYFYGRGTLDMKNGAVAQIVAMLRLKAENAPLDRNVTLLLTGDEEGPQKGSEYAATKWREWTDAEFALNGDGDGGRVNEDGKDLGFPLIAAEKTFANFEFRVRNRGGHSSKPRPDNAIYTLARALTRMERYRFEPMLIPVTKAYFEARQKQEPGPLGDAMRAWIADPADGAAADVIEADPNEVGQTRTRCVATMLSGGHAIGALAQLATANVNCRVMPGVTNEAVLAELKRIVADPEVEVVATITSTPAPPSPLRADVLNAFTRTVHKYYPGSPIVPGMMTGSSDGRNLRAAGIPTYIANGLWVVSPTDERAHGLDERVPVRAFYQNLLHWYEMVKLLATTTGGLTR